MVNEINKPPSSENVQLGERLLASQRQLQEMQQEHRQLLQEMEALRQRATELSRISIAQEEVQRQLQQQRHVTSEQQLIAVSNTTRNEEAAAPIAVTPSTIAMEQAPSESIEPQVENTVLNNSKTESVPSASETQLGSEGEAEGEENLEAANYLNEKLAEIARLKAQYNRVQNLISTTNLIEEHLASKSPDSTNGSPSVSTSSTPSNQLHSSEAPSDSASVSSAPPTTRTSTTTNENEELISTMMNMFTDFTGDLRAQAEGLRAERERIRALKEELLNRKKSS